MKSRPLGKTGLVVSEVALGTWGLTGEAYGAIPPNEAREVIARCLTMGFTLIETAACYGFGPQKKAGAMETLLGDAIRHEESEHGHDPTKLTLVTRVGTDRDANPPRKRFSSDFIDQEARQARTRLGDQVKLVVLLHNPSRRALESREASDTLRRLSDSGVITSWGVSAGSRAVAEEALAQDTPVLSLTYNAFQVSPLRELNDQIKAQQTGLLVHSVLAYGLLAARWSGTKVFPTRDHRRERWPDGSVRKRIQQLDALRPLVSGEITSIRSGAVRFALQNELVSSVVLGPRIGVHVDQLVRDIQSEGPYLPEAKMSALEGRLQHLGLR